MEIQIIEAAEDVEVSASCDPPGDLVSLRDMSRNIDLLKLSARSTCCAA